MIKNKLGILGRKTIDIIPRKSLADKWPYRRFKGDSEQIILNTSTKSHFLGKPLDSFEKVTQFVNFF